MSETPPNSGATVEDVALVNIYPDNDALRSWGQMQNELPLEHRAAVAEFYARMLAKYDVSPSDATLPGTFTDICADNCRMKDGEYGAMSFIYGVPDEDEQALLDTTVDLTQAVTPAARDGQALAAAVCEALGDDLPSGLDEVDGEMTIAELIVQRVRQQEHAAHRVGLKMNRKMGVAAARMYFFKVLLIIHAFSSAAEATEVSAMLVRPAFYNRTAGAFQCKPEPPQIVSLPCRFFGEHCLPIKSNVTLYERSSCMFEYSKCEVSKAAELGGKYSKYLLGWSYGFVDMVLSFLGSVFYGFFQIIAMVLMVCVAMAWQIGASSLEFLLVRAGWVSTEVSVGDYMGRTGSSVLRQCVEVLAGVFLGRISHLFLRLGARMVMALLQLIWRWLFRLQVKIIAKLGSIVPQSGEFTTKVLAGKGLFRTATFLMPEMSQNGSDFAHTKMNTAMMAVCAVDRYSKQMQHVGFAFRHIDYLITAYHVADNLLNAEVDGYLVPFKMEKGRCVADPSRMVLWHPSVEKNIVPDDSSSGINLQARYDCYIERLGNSFFSTMSVSSLKLAFPSNATNVRTYGYFTPHLMSAIGLVAGFDNDTDGFILHTSSTRDGSSGCPLVVGSTFCGLHVGVAGDGKNRALSAAVIQLFIMNAENLKAESEMLVRDNIAGVLRNSKGREVRIREYDFGYTMVDVKSGREKPIPREMWEQIERMEKHPVNIGYGRIDAETRQLKVEVPDTVVREVLVYEDDGVVAPQAISRPLTPHKQLLSISENSVLAVCDEVRSSINTPHFKGYDPKSEHVLCLEEARAAGYDDQKYAFPTFKNMIGAVAESFTKHAAVFVEAAKRCVVPDESLIYQARRITIDMLKTNRYEFAADPLSAENIKRILHSGLIKGDRSPGRRFIVMGLMTNEAVLAKFTDDEIVAMVQKEEPPQDVNVFGKLDAHKRTKLDEGYLRLISGADLIEQIRCHAYFSPLNVAMAENWVTSPIKVGFSPIQQRSGQRFYNMLAPPVTGKKSKKYKWVEDDTSTWDWRFLGFIVESVCRIAVELGSRPAGMTEESFRDLKDKAYENAVRQFKYPFVLPDGTVIERLRPGIMTSGAVITLPFNSIAMVFLDTVAKLGIGYDREQILTLFVLIVGGDDKLQRVPFDFDAKAYVDYLNSMGLKIHDHKVHDTVDGVEFFSWKFSKDPKSKEIQWVPTRFAKHVHTLRATKFEDLRDALVSHAYNWAHDKEKFEYFRRVFERASSERPDLFDLRNFPDRQRLINYYYGYESSFQVDPAVLAATA